MCVCGVRDKMGDFLDGLITPVSKGIRYLDYDIIGLGGEREWRG